MSDTKLTRVRVLERRSLSLAESNGSTHYTPGEELELPADEAKQLIADGVVQVTKL